MKLKQSNWSWTDNKGYQNYLKMEIDFEGFASDVFKWKRQYLPLPGRLNSVFKM